MKSDTFGISEDGADALPTLSKASSSGLVDEVPFSEKPLGLKTAIGVD